MLFGNSEARRKRKSKTTPTPIEAEPVSRQWDAHEHAYTGEIGGLGK
jgi:hypothetical protein